MIVEVIIQAGNWPAEAELWSRQAANALKDELGESFGEIAILLTDNAHMQKLNSEFRSIDKATNVLSWPASEYSRELGETPVAIDADEAFLGDLALGLETITKEALAVGLEAHFKHLVIHGVLHLCGYDHIEDQDAQKMECIEIAALARLNIANPYNEEETL